MRPAGRVALLAALLMSADAFAGYRERLRDHAALEPVAFTAVPGWASDDHAAALATFRSTCGVLAGETPVVRPAVPHEPLLAARCREALTVPDSAARQFFETRFEAFAIRPHRGAGFMTAYFEPEVEASLERSAVFPVPVLARPPDLVSVTPGAVPGLDPALAAARRGPTGALEPHPDRAAIWAGVLDGRDLEIAWLRDHVDLFIAQVQGSMRLRLADGRTLRLGYAGRTGHPYTSIGRILVEDGQIGRDEMSLEVLKGWLRAHPAEGRAVMERNRSYIFFQRLDGLAEGAGPVGGAGVPLQPHRSIAVDRALWPYGLPFHVVGRLPAEDGVGDVPLARLMVAQDTGSAIVGPARIDYFLGSGAAAGTRAGRVRHPIELFVLLPRT